MSSWISAKILALDIGPGISLQCIETIKYCMSCRIFNFLVAALLAHAYILGDSLGLLLFLNLNLFIFNWEIIALQNSFGFCQTSTWISHRYTYVLSLLNLPAHLLAHPTPLGCPRTPGWAPCIIQQIPTGYLFYIWWCMCFNTTLSACHTLSILHCVHKSVVYVCNAIFALQTGSPVPFFSRLHICALIHDICFSLSDLLHSA